MNLKPFRTLQIVGNSAYGGATYLILEWCRFLVEKGCVVDVLSTDDVTIRELRTIPNLNVITDIFIPREIDIYVDMIAFAKLFVLLLKNKYSVVHTYSATPGVLGRFAARLAGNRAVFHHQAGWSVNSESGLMEHFFFRHLEYIAALASTRGICVSRAEFEHAMKYRLVPRRKLETIVNGIDPAPYLNAVPIPLRKLLSLEPDTILVGCTGRLAAIKDFPTVLQAARILLNKYKERKIVFVLIGDGQDRVDLERLAIELGVEDAVHFLGFRRDIPELLAAIDIYVTASLREGLSISVLEAMASAKPIVASSISPNSELIEPEHTGLLFVERSAEKLADAINRFIQNPDLARTCGANARATVLEKYTLDRMFSETWNLYERFAGI